MEFVSLGDVVRFGYIISNPVISGVSTNADETPKFYAFRNNLDTATLTGDFVQRTGLNGVYRGSGIFNAGAGFSAGDYVEVHASGRISGAVLREIVKSFVINDTFNANITHVSGVPVQIYDLVSADVRYISGVPVTLSDIMQADLISISGVPVSPADTFNADVTKISGVPVATSNYVPDKVWNANLTQYTTNNTAGSGLNKAIEDLYFANIKFVKDGSVPRDEYVVNWFKNGYAVEHSGVPNPAISVFRTSVSTALISNAVLGYNNPFNGAIRYNETTNLATSGEPYLAVTSGIINGTNRVWSNLVGIDYLS